MTTQRLHRASYSYSKAAELLDMDVNVIIDMVDNGTLEHTACGKLITRDSLQAAMAPESEQKWLHGEKSEGCRGVTNCRMLEPNELIEDGDEWKNVFGEWVKTLRAGRPSRGIIYRRPLPDEAEELTAADVESDGWIDWHGGECPVDGAVDVRFRCGHVQKHRSGSSLCWTHEDHEFDIVAYRVVPTDQQAEPEKQPQHTPGPWGVEQTQTTNWIGPLRADGKVDRIVAHNDRHNLTPTALAERDANARLIAQAPSFESTIEECLKQRDEAEAAADELASLILGEPVDWAFHNEAWQRAVEVLKGEETADDSGCHVVQAEKQPQPGWYMVGIGERGPYLYVGPDDEGNLVFQTGKYTFESFVSDVECRHLPNCTGFDYVPPPEQTPAEKRLRELGIERDTDGDYRSVTHRTVLGLSDFTSEQVEAIAAHMREREGGATDE